MYGPQSTANDGNHGEDSHSLWGLAILGTVERGVLCFILSELMSVQDLRKQKLRAETTMEKFGSEGRESGMDVRVSRKKAKGIVVVFFFFFF